LKYTCLMCLAGILWNLDAILEPFPLHTSYHSWPWIFELACSAHDRPAVCRCICRDSYGSLVSRPFQQVSSRSTRRFLKQFTNSSYYSRGLHSAIFSFIGAMGFLASAVLPPDAYLVSSPNRSSKPQGTALTIAILAPLRLSDRCSQRCLRLYPTPSGLALIEPPLHSRRRSRHRP
jgi:hypothetical protein